MRQQIKTVTQSTKAEESHSNVNYTCHTWHSEVMIYTAENNCLASTQQSLSTQQQFSSVLVINMLSQEIVSLAGLWTLQALFFISFFTLINWEDLD